MECCLSYMKCCLLCMISFSADMSSARDGGYQVSTSQTLLRLPWRRAPDSSDVARPTQDTR
uniref:Uncharacterized protein n=1 Tax=Timema poppense TaxID=170557 RepID=A0A7R9DYG2_TIMPO|nr:unnamed protein product [Timema poppensis]